MAARTFIFLSLLGLPAAVGIPASDVQSLVQKNVGVKQLPKTIPYDIGQTPPGPPPPEKVNASENAPETPETIPTGELPPVYTAAPTMADMERGMTEEDAKLCDVFEEYHSVMRVINAFKIDQTWHLPNCTVTVPGLKQYARNFAHPGYLDAFKSDNTYLKQHMYLTSQEIHREADMLHSTETDYVVDNERILQTLEAALVRVEEGISYIEQADWQTTPMIVTPSFSKTSALSHVREKKAPPAKIKDDDAKAPSNSYWKPDDKSFNYWKVKKESVRRAVDAHAYIRECAHIMPILYEFSHSRDTIRGLHDATIPNLRTKWESHVAPWLSHDCLLCAMPAKEGFDDFLDNLQEGFAFLDAGMTRLIDHVEAVLSADNECQGDFWRGRQSAHFHITGVDDHANIMSINE